MATRTASQNRFPLVRLLYEDDTPATPPSGEGHLVAGDDKLLRWIDDDGVLHDLTAAAVSEITDIPTSELNTALRLRPDGAGGTEWATTAASLTDHTHANTGAGSDGGGAALAPTSLNAAALFRISGIITSTINADQNDFNPGSLHAITAIYFNSFTANRTITGINAGSTGEVLILQNNNTFSLILSHESGSSTAANRFRCPNATTHTVRQGGSALLVYLQGRWCVIAA